MDKQNQHIRIRWLVGLQDVASSKMQKNTISYYAGCMAIAAMVNKADYIG